LDAADDADDLAWR